MTPELRQRVLDADLVLAVGTRLGEATTEGYTLIESPLPRQQLVHVYPDAGELGRVYAPTLGIVSSVAAFAGALGTLQPGPAATRPEAVRNAQAAHRASPQPPPPPRQPPPPPP